MGCISGRASARIASAERYGVERCNAGFDRATAEPYDRRFRLSQYHARESIALLTLSDFRDVIA